MRSRVWFVLTVVITLSHSANPSHAVPLSVESTRHCQPVLDRCIKACRIGETACFEACADKADECKVKYETDKLCGEGVLPSACAQKPTSGGPAMKGRPIRKGQD